MWNPALDYIIDEDKSIENAELCEFMDNNQLTKYGISMDVVIGTSWVEIILSYESLLRAVKDIEEWYLNDQ